MIICTKCGFQNSDDASFCGSCGSFLEWTGQKIQPPAAPTEEPTSPEAEPERGGIIVQARRVLGLDGRPDGGAADAPDAATGRDAGIVVAPASAPPAPVAPAPVVVTSRRVAPAVELAMTGAPVAAEPTPAATEAATEAAPAVQAPAFEPPPVRPAPPQPVAQKPAAPPTIQPTAAPPTFQPGAVQPDAVKPGLARPRPAPGSVVPVAEAPRPGELVCASCGTGNEATRRFCRRCGASLASVPVVRRVPWWRSLFTRRAKATPAGARPLSVQRHAAAAAGGGGGSFRKLLAVVLVGVVVVGAAGFVLVPGFHDAVTGAVNQVRMDVAPNYVPVHVAGQATGPAIAGHGPTMAFDGFNNTYWAAPASASQPSVRASFSPPADIAKVLVTSGDPSDFESQPRPRTIQLDFMDAKGGVVFTKQFDLQDVKDFQTLDVAASGAASVVITVLSVYQSTAGKNVSITEVEFRSRQ